MLSLGAFGHDAAPYPLRSTWPLHSAALAVAPGAPSSCSSFGDRSKLLQHGVAEESTHSEGEGAKWYFGEDCEPDTRGFDTEGQYHNVWPEVAQVFRRCIEDRGGGTANALPRLLAIRDRFPIQFDEALLHCVDVLLSEIDTGTDGPNVGFHFSGEAAATELLAAAAAENERRTPEIAETLQRRLLRHLIAHLGGADSASAPKRKQVRHRAAELLWRLLASELGVDRDDQARWQEPDRLIDADLAGAEKVFVRLARDKAPTVRHSGVFGLAACGAGSRAALTALCNLAARDPMSRTRVAAMAQLQLQHAVGTCYFPSLLESISARVLDVSVNVRVQVFVVLANLKPQDICPSLLADLLLRGMKDANVSVRAECECTLRTWLSSSADIVASSYSVSIAESATPLLLLLRHLAPEEGGAQAEAAELTIQRLLSRSETDLESVAQFAVEAILTSTEPVDSEVVLFARVAYQTLDCIHFPDSVLQGGIAPLRRSLSAIELAMGERGRQGIFVLSELLRVLLRIDVAHETSQRALLHVATAVLLRAPLDAGVKSTRESVRGSLLYLAFAVCRRACTVGTLAASSSRFARFSVSRQAISRFSETVQVILRAACHQQKPPPFLGNNNDALVAVCTNPVSMSQHISGSQMLAANIASVELAAAGGIRSNANNTQGTRHAGCSVTDSQPPETRPLIDLICTLGDRLSSEAAEASLIAKEVEALQGSVRRFTSQGDFVRAREARCRLSLAESTLAAAKSSQEVVERSLVRRLRHVLNLVEVVLLQAGDDLAQDFSVSLLLEDLLRPALVLIDKASGHPSDATWPALRVKVLKCIALHASLSPDTSVQHWHFFKSVLTRYIPTCIQASEVNLHGGSEADVVEVCFNFLADSWILHNRHALLSSDLGFESRTAGGCLGGELFDIVAPMLGGSSHIPRRLRNCLARRICACLLFGDRSVSGNAVVVVGIGLASAGLCWALAWLAVEAFSRRPLISKSKEAHGAITSLELEGAVLRGQLLGFFGVLSGLSEWHACILAAATECVLSLETWELGRFVRLGVGQRWRALALPNLARFFARQFLQCSSGKEQIAGWWLEGLWRPLALACLETGALLGTAEAELPQALLAALLGMVASQQQSPARSHRCGLVMATAEDIFSFVPGSRRHAFAAEIAWVINRVVELSGWNAASESNRRNLNVAQNGVALPPMLLEVRDSAAQLAASCLPKEAWDWASVYRLAEERRLRLRRAVALLGVDVRSIVVAASVSVSLTEWSAIDAPGKTSRGGRGTLELKRQRQPETVGSSRTIRGKVARKNDEGLHDVDSARTRVLHRTLEPKRFRAEATSVPLLVASPHHTIGRGYERGQTEQQTLLEREPLPQKHVDINPQGQRVEVVGAIPAIGKNSLRPKVIDIEANTVMTKSRCSKELVVDEIEEVDDVVFPGGKVACEVHPGLQTPMASASIIYGMLPRTRSSHNPAPTNSSQVDHMSDQNVCVGVMGCSSGSSRSFQHFVTNCGRQNAGFAFSSGGADGLGGHFGGGGGGCGGFGTCGGLGGSGKGPSAARYCDGFRKASQVFG